jgi:hypothetical protein
LSIQGNNLSSLALRFWDILVSYRAKKSPVNKNMAETVTLQMPEALYQRLAIAAGATRAIAG